MPNHCENDLWIKGPIGEIDKIIRLHIADDNSLDCNSVIPYPHKFVEMDEKRQIWLQANGGAPYAVCDLPKSGFESGGYEWCCDNWGTKWGTYESSPVQFLRGTTTYEHIKLSFLSAWSPPVPIVLELLKMYPTCSFILKYYEAGCGFKGIVEGSNGSYSEIFSSEYRGTRGG